MALLPNRAVAQTFMERLPGGVTLYALWPDGGAPSPKTLAQALMANERGYNVYFGLNVVRRGVNKKATKDEIEIIRAVAGDIDWGYKTYGGRFSERMRELANTVLRALVKEIDPQPSWIIFTGGGLQPIWLIELLPNTLDNQARAEAVGAYIANRFGGDGVQNIDRILRLSGSINHPKRAKREAGQPTQVAEFKIVSGQTYRLEDLEAAWDVDAASRAKNNPARPRQPPLDGLNDDLCGGMKEREAGEALFTCQQIGPFIASIPDGPFSVRESWTNPRTGERTDTGWRDWLWVMSGVADDDPSLADECERLFNKVSEQAGGDTSQNEEQWRATAGRKARRVAAGQSITTVATLVKLATDLGWTGYAVSAAMSMTAFTPASATPGVWTLSHEAVALKAAKSRLHTAFQVARVLGRHRIRGDLVRVALTVREPAVRARLMFALAALLIKSNHSPEEIVEAVIACGFPRAHAANAFLWAEKNIAKGAVA